MPPHNVVAVDVHHAFTRRETPAQRVKEDAGLLARLCHDMAARFHQGGKLLVFGTGEAGTDAAHIAVEFMHPVIVGKRALPALALSNDTATITGVGAHEGFSEIFSHQLRAFADPCDIALGIAMDDERGAVREGIAAARERGLLTAALLAGSPEVGADIELRVEAPDPLVAKEVHVTIYHVLWELTHVFLEHPEVIA